MSCCLHCSGPLLPVSSLSQTNFLTFEFQQVSRLLAFVFLLSASSEVYSFTPSSKALSESHWASYFHQASLGTNLNYQLFTNNAGRYQVQHLANAEVNHPSFISLFMCNVLHHLYHHSP